MSSIFSGNNKVVQLRKRPKETSSKAKTSRVPFREKAVKELSIPAITNTYNYYIGVVNEFDYLTA